MLQVVRQHLTGLLVISWTSSSSCYCCFLGPHWTSLVWGYAVSTISCLVLFNMFYVKYYNVSDHVNIPVCLSVLLVCLTILLHPVLYYSILLSNIIFFILLPLPTHYNEYLHLPSIMHTNKAIHLHFRNENLPIPYKTKGSEKG